MIKQEARRKRDELEEVDSDYSETEVDIATDMNLANAEDDQESEERRQLQLREEDDLIIGDGEVSSRFVRFDADYLAKATRGKSAAIAKRYEDHVRERHFFLRQLARRRALFESSYETSHACRQLVATFGEGSRSL